jgi:hypothetical protein
VTLIYKAHRRIEQRFGLMSLVELYEFAKQMDSAGSGVPFIGTEATPKPRSKHPAPGMCDHGAHAGAVA